MDSDSETFTASDDDDNEPEFERGHSDQDDYEDLIKKKNRRITQAQTRN